MKNTRFPASLLAILFLLGGCSATQKTLVPKAVVPPTENALLWKITGPGVKKPGWLFGTIHLIPASKFTIAEPVKKALADSKRLTTEIDLKSMFSLGAQLSMMTKATMKGGKTLKTLLSADDYALVKAKLDEKGLPIGMMERMKPMFLTMMIGQESEGDDHPKAGPMDGTTSVEMEIYGVAKRQKMETAGLETVDYQLAVFDSIPYEEQAKMLVEAIRSPEEKGSDEFAKMVELYLSQDIGQMAVMVAGEADYAKYEDLLLNRRNENWVPLIGRQLREKPTFFAVGAGHLGGEKGVVALLRKAGWTVEPERF